MPIIQAKPAVAQLGQGFFEGDPPKKKKKKKKKKKGVFKFEKD